MWKPAGNGFSVGHNLAICNKCVDEVINKNNFTKDFRLSLEATSMLTPDSCSLHDSSSFENKANDAGNCSH